MHKYTISVKNDYAWSVWDKLKIKEIMTMFDRFFQLTDGTIDITKDILDIWREKIFSVIFITSLIVVTLPYLSNMKISISSGKILNALIYTLVYLIAISLIFLKVIPFKIRAWLGLSLFYMIGVISLFTVGPAAGGRMWLLLFAVLATLLLGLRAGIIALIINIATILVWVLAWINNYFAWTLETTFVPNQAAATGFSFLFMNFVLIISIGLFVSVLKERFEKERILFDNLTISNKRLEKENVERKQAELALRESEERYREVVENMTTAVAVYDVIGDGEDFIFKDINRSGAHIGGKSREEHIGKIVQEVYPGIYQMGLFNIFKKVWRTGKAERFPVKLYKDDRLDIWTENYVFKLRSGEIVAVYEDVSERMKAETALKESEERYRMVLDAASDGLWDINIKTGEAYYSPTFAKTLGYSIDDFKGENNLFKDLLHTDERVNVLKDIQDHLDGLTDEFRKNHRLQNKNGTWQWFLSRGKVVERDQDGKPMRFLGTLEDNTQYKRVQEEKERLEQQLKQAQKMEAIGTLAGGIAHDFNNILSPIIMYSEMIMMDLPQESPTFHNVRQIFKSSIRARDLVKQILTFSRKSEQTLTSIKIIPIIKECLKMLRSSLPATIEIVQDITTKCDTIMGDPTQIHQILMNICTNASHAMEKEGGTLKLRLSEEEMDTVTTKTFMDIHPGPYLKIEISDTGQGMDDKTIEKIFEPYFTTKEQGRGTGLGLAVVHGIVKDYGGFINVESELGKGTTVNVYLPKIIEESIPVSEPREKILRGSERILFVDDEKAAVDAGELMLSFLGYSVKSRTSSIEALEVFRNNPDEFDLVITDMTMPNMTGKDLSIEIIDIRPDIPIILCTGYSSNIDEERAKKLGIKAFVMKPIITHEIANVIRSVLD